MRALVLTAVIALCCAASVSAKPARLTPYPEQIDAISAVNICANAINQDVARTKLLGMPFVLSGHVVTENEFRYRAISVCLRDLLNVSSAALVSSPS
jgi:L-cysteine desulfidase